jgi:hypothetical protein
VDDVTITITVSGRASAAVGEGTDAGGTGPAPRDIGQPSSVETAVGAPKPGDAGEAAFAAGQDAPPPMSLAELGVADATADPSAPGPTLEDPGGGGAAGDAQDGGDPPQDVGSPDD